MKKKWTFIVFTLFIMLALAACSSKDNNNNANGNENGNDNSNEVIDEALPEADLEGIPDVVIEINGEDITKDDFSSMYEQQFQDRKSTRLNSSHVAISYAVFCLKKKKDYKAEGRQRTDRVRPNHTNG